MVKVKSGEVFTSELKLCERWQWSRNKVRAYLKSLEEWGRIERKPFNKGTTILIKKYNDYQKNGIAESTTKNTIQSVVNTGIEEYYRTSEGTSESTSESTSEGTQTIHYKQNTINTLKKEKVRHKYGEYKNVLLSDEELQKLKGEFNERVVMDKIEALSCYMKSTGKGYKSHIATLRNWIRRDEGEVKNESTGEKCEIYRGLML